MPTYSTVVVCRSRSICLLAQCRNKYLGSDQIYAWPGAVGSGGMHLCTVRRIELSASTCSCTACCSRRPTRSPIPRDLPKRRKRPPTHLHNSITMPLPFPIPFPVPDSHLPRDAISCPVIPCRYTICVCMCASEPVVVSSLPSLFIPSADWGYLKRVLLRSGRAVAMLCFPPLGLGDTINSSR